MNRPPWSKFTQKKRNKVKDEVIALAKKEDEQRLIGALAEFRQQRGGVLLELLNSLSRKLPPPVYANWGHSEYHSGDIPETNFLIPLEILEKSKNMQDLRGRFQARQAEIGELVTGWGAFTRGVLANKIREGLRKHGVATDPVRPRLVLGAANRDLLEGVDANTALLLRADSLLRFGDDPNSNVLYFDSLKLSIGRLAKSHYDTEVASIARILLSELGGKDAAFVELDASDETRLVCGRCHSTHGSWLSLRQWKKIKNILLLSDRSGITYKYAHDLRSNALKPLVARVPVLKAKLPKKTDVFKCKMCEQMKVPFRYVTPIDMFRHLSDVHNVLKPDIILIEGYRIVYIVENPYTRTLNDKDPQVRLDERGKPAITQYYNAECPTYPVHTSRMFCITFDSLVYVIFIYMQRTVSLSFV
ncbi:ATP-dependent DNA helicase/nuclease subunit A [Ceratobasidium sp. AG-Ba]|nr:ATP-dependent DNA helicase/nuclease subunit A [Ceratobasidium sp. AG-Ba]